MLIISENTQFTFWNMKKSVNKQNWQDLIYEINSVSYFSFPKIFGFRTSYSNLIIILFRGDLNSYVLNHILCESNRWLGGRNRIMNHYGFDKLSRKLCGNRVNRIYSNILAEIESILDDICDDDRSRIESVSWKNGMTNWCSEKHSLLIIVNKYDHI